VQSKALYQHLTLLTELHDSPPSATSFFRYEYGIAPLKEKNQITYITDALNIVPLYMHTLFTPFK
jgi:hypothetical protein